MYAFQARIPASYVIELIAILRGTQERNRGEILMLCGATLGEIGALVKHGVDFSATASDEDSEQQVVQLELILQSLSRPSEIGAAEAKPNFDITPYIPIILKIIEIILQKRGLI